MVLGGYDKIATPLVKRAYSFPNRYDSEQPITSLFEFAVAQCQRQPCIKNHETLARAFKAAEVLSKFATIQRVLRSADQKCLELWNRDSTASDGPNFHVTLTSPNDEATIANTINTSLTCFTPAIIDELFSRGSWPWTLSREAALGFLADGTADEPSEYWYRVATELGRLERSAQLGPAAAWCCLELVDRATQDHSADTLKAWVAECGLRQTSGPQLAQDIELFAAADAYWASTLQDLVDDFVSLPAEERQELLALLPKPWAQALTEIQQRRADKPDEATGEALAHVLRNRWQDLAGKAIEKRLRDYAASTISTPSTAAKPSTPSQQR